MFHIFCRAIKSLVASSHSVTFFPTIRGRIRFEGVFFQHSNSSSWDKIPKILFALMAYHDQPI